MAVYKPPRAWDGIPGGLCRACGMMGKHTKPAECIDALRQRIANLEIRVNALEKAALAARLAPKGE